MLTSQEQREYASASAVVEEALTSMRTVVAYGGEEVEANRWVWLMEGREEVEANRWVWGGRGVHPMGLTG